MDRDYFPTLARHNRWANEQLYRAVAELPGEEYFKSRPSFFGSIHATLNHLLVADRLWLGRIAGRPVPDLQLDTILYGDLAGLRVSRTAEDDIIVNTVDEIDAGRLQRNLAYRTLAGVETTTPLRFVLAHWFNHATHHRGQVHDMLSQTAVSPPPLDLLIYLRSS